MTATPYQVAVFQQSTGNRVPYSLVTLYQDESLPPHDGHEVNVFVYLDPLETRNGEFRITEVHCVDHQLDVKAQLDNVSGILRLDVDLTDLTRPYLSSYPLFDSFLSTGSLLHERLNKLSHLCGVTESEPESLEKVYRKTKMVYNGLVSEEVGVDKVRFGETLDLRFTRHLLLTKYTKLFILKFNVRLPLKLLRPLTYLVLYMI